MKLILPTIAYWNDFEDLICNLFKYKYPGENVEKYGRSGQYQAGVDVYISDSGIGVQCKKKDGLAGSNLKVTEIEEEVEKAMNFNPKLQKYIICYTGQRDTKLQDKVNEINKRHKDSEFPLFKVELMSWEKISEEIQSFPELLMAYLADILRRVDEIKYKYNYKKANAMENVHKILSNILEEFETKKSGKPYMEIYSSQLGEFLIYLDPPLPTKINQLLGEIEDFVPMSGIDLLIMGKRELRNPSGKIKAKLRELVKETSLNNDSK
ncbi:hypothetical protein [Bacillus cereus]|uniref:hypothetical protein n=1 Tax=Bacillus cereus group TaxID=86661 RepID=UPI0001A02A13|nr:hypothetical protein [Bacillus cereus]EEK80265.1 hypothetical protein bcere0009_8060 [Bacillus cereus R309803]HDR4560688.1 hypothetical protein [Bacillus luti]